MVKLAIACTEQELLTLGLSYLKPRVRRMQPHLQARAFKRFYGTSPKIMADVWARLRSSPDKEIAIDQYCKPKYLLIYYRWIKRYPSQLEISLSLFDVSENTLKTWNRILAKKIGSLRQSIIDSNWASLGMDEVVRLFMTVDGVHMLIEEPRPFTIKASSHKFGKKSALSYELGLSTTEQKIIWLNGPFLAGTPDRDIFKAKLKAAIMMKQHQLQEPLLRSIADDGYFAHELIQVLSFRNEFDSANLAYFKDRALARHERVNGRAKNFRILDQKFRHSRGNNPDYEFPFHKDVVESVFVTIQLELDHGEMTLFDPWP